MTKYDVEAYPYAIRTFSLPARLAALAQLYGHEAVPPDGCRVLEIGGGNGVNVVNMALCSPQSEFFNFDLSKVAVADGQALVRELGISNMRMEAMDILEAGDDLGSFDYIIAHGVYAWVPEAVRKSLMALIGRILSPRGIALVSYNCAPGCHIRSILRDLMHRAAAPYEDAKDRTGVAMALVAFMARNWDEAVPAQAALLKESKRILESNPRVLFHDELSDVWQPQFASDVISQARTNGLDYLGDTQLDLTSQELFPNDFMQEVAKFFGEDEAHLEHLRDFHDVRSFRTTLLRRAGPKLDRRFQPHRLKGLYADGYFKPLEEQARGAMPFGWTGASGVEITTADSGLARLCAAFNEHWPQAVPVVEVASNDDMLEAVGKLFAAGSLGLASRPFSLVGAAGERPRVSRLARALAARGAESVATLRHTTVRIDDELTRTFLLALDGTRDRQALVELMRPHVEAAGEALDANIDRMMQTMATSGLLEG